LDLTVNDICIALLGVESILLVWWLYTHNKQLRDIESEVIALRKYVFEIHDDFDSRCEKAAKALSKLKAQKGGKTK